MIDNPREQIPEQIGLRADGAPLGSRATPVSRNPRPAGLGSGFELERVTRIELALSAWEAAWISR